MNRREFLAAALGSTGAALAAPLLAQKVPAPEDQTRRLVIDYASCDPLLTRAIVRSGDGTDLTVPEAGAAPPVGRAMMVSRAWLEGDLLTVEYYRLATGRYDGGFTMLEHKGTETVTYRDWTIELVDILGGTYRKARPGDHKHVGVKAVNGLCWYVRKASSTQWLMESAIAGEERAMEKVPGFCRWIRQYEVAGITPTERELARLREEYGTKCASS